MITTTIKAALHRLARLARRLLDIATGDGQTVTVSTVTGSYHVRDLTR